MLAKRIIPCLDVTDGRVVKGVNFVDLIDAENISLFGTSAKFIAALEKAGAKPRETHKLGRLKAILSTGSPLAHESFEYVYRDIKRDVCLSSISGGTTGNSLSATAR